MGTQCYIYGGASTPENLLLDDVWVFDFTELDFSGAVGGWSQLDVRGGAGGRKGHSMVAYDDMLLVFGGVTKSGYSNDLWVLSHKNKWIKANTSGRSPSPRGFHSACLLEAGYLVIFGGLDVVKEGRHERTERYSVL